MIHRDQQCTIDCIFIIFVISFFLLGYYVKNCIKNEGPEEYCHDMMISTIFFCSIDLLVILSLILSVLCSPEDDGTICMVKSIVDLKNGIKNCCSHNLKVIFNEFCCYYKKESKDIPFGIPIQSV